MIRVTALSNNVPLQLSSEENHFKNNLNTNTEYIIHT